MILFGYKGKPWTPGRVIIQITIVLFGLLWSYPLFKMFQKSFYGKGIGNYTRVLFQADSFMIRKGYNFEIADFWIYLQNSVLITLCDLVLVLIVVSLGAYAFSKMEFPLKNILYIMTLIGMMIPGVSFIVPYFAILKNFGIIDNPIGLVGPHVAGAVPMSMMLIKNGMDSINNEMIEAAIIDGCTRKRIFLQICIPLAKPAIGTAAIFVFNGSWNDYLLPLVLLNSPESMTMTLLPQRFTAFGGGTNMGVIFACLVLISIPIFVLYLFCQRYMVRGLALGSIK
jgi:ABC-type glycerol-3-phosphate transport system permease component